MEVKLKENDYLDHWILNVEWIDYDDKKHTYTYKSCCEDNDFAKVSKQHVWGYFFENFEWDMDDIYQVKKVVLAEVVLDKNPVGAKEEQMEFEWSE